MLVHQEVLQGADEQRPISNENYQFSGRVWEFSGGYKRQVLFDDNQLHQIGLSHCVNTLVFYICTRDINVSFHIVYYKSNDKSNNIN